MRWTKGTTTMVASSQFLYDTERSAGIVAWILLGASVLWGLALSTKSFRGKVKPNWMTDLHRFLGGLSLIFVLVHVAAIVSDTYVSKYVTITPLNALVPFTGSYHPSMVAWGIVGFYLLLAVELTSLARKKLPKKVWRSVHFLSFPLFATTTVHALTAPATDRNVAVWKILIIATCIAVTAFTFIRVQRATKQEVSAGPPNPRLDPVRRG